MKKLTALLLVALMLLPATACGGANEPGASDASAAESSQEAAGAHAEPTEEPASEPAEEPTPEPTAVPRYSVGETVTIGDYEICIKRFEFSDCLRNLLDEKGYLPVSEDDSWSEVFRVKDNPYYADADHIMLMIEFTEKNVGKTAIDASRVFYGMKVVYGDGYEFEASGNPQHKSGSFYGFDMEPLSGEVLCRAAVKLPIAAKQGDEPLTLVIVIDGAPYEFALK